jgi:serine/threonine protein kinase
MLVQVKNTLQELHNKGVYVGDFNDSNILFDKNFDIYFIDVDSYSVDKYHCTVAMESFKDPKCVGDNFSDKTDDYAFSVVAFKSLTRLHPFGGTMDPDIPLLERMAKGISVIDRANVTIPRIAKKWNFMYPKFAQELKDIYEYGKRFLISDSLEHFAQNLKFCTTHKEFYYGKFATCPLCDAGAKVISAPVMSGNINGIPFTLLFSDNDCILMLSRNSYLTKDKFKCIRNNAPGTNGWMAYEPGYKYYCSDMGDIHYKIGDQTFEVHTRKQVYTGTKTNKSPITVQNDKMYYIDQSNRLVEFHVTDKGNVVNKIADVACISLYSSE